MDAMFSIHIPENPTVQQLEKIRDVLLTIAGVNQLPAPPVNVAAAPPPPALDAAAVFTAAANAPPPPPVPHIVAATGTGHPNNMNAERDSTDLPYDDRIHSGNKAKNQDGSWKKKRGVDDATVASVTAELRGTPPPPPPSGGAGDIPASLDRRPAPPPPPAATAPTPPAPGGANPFVDLVQKITKYLSEGKLTQAKVAQCAASVGLANLPALSQRADLIPAFDAQIEMHAAGLA